MNKLIHFIITLIPVFAFSQSAFYNEGGQVYLQKGALLSVQGDFTNDNKGSLNGSVQNDGIIEVSGNFNNTSGATFSVYNDNTSTDRAVKFIGSGQTVSGSMNTAGSASFYNLVVDQASASDIVKLSTSVTIEGSLVFGTANLTTTYNPSNLYTNNNEKGLVKTYNDSTEYALNITNGLTDAIAGYPAMVINGAPATGFILTSGIRGTSNGGLQREVASAASYDFPIGTADHGFNAMRMNFISVPSGGGLVVGKFNDGSDNPSGAVGSISQECIGCTAENPTPSNNGFNRFFTSNPCNNDAPQWVVLQDAIINHGYWSFSSADNNQNYKYSVEAFPNNYTAEGSSATDIWRTIEYRSAYGFNPSAANVTWNADIDSITNANDLLEYSLNTGSCYTGSGVPGGVYSGFGQFTLKKSNNGDALPVKLVSLNATPAGQNINVTWSTALEINNNGFEVQRSSDGVNFITLGFVQGHDNSTVTQNYIYADNNVSANTVYYYRLNQVDNNGNSALSYVVSAEVIGAAALTISDPMPNPASSATRIVLNSTVSMDINVKIYSITGQMVSVMPLTLSAGDNTINLEIGALSSGNYNAVIETGARSFTKSFIIAR